MQTDPDRYVVEVKAMMASRHMHFTQIGKLQFEQLDIPALHRVAELLKLMPL